MAGTIFGIGLSQRNDPNGLPESGWLLYIFQANSDTPVTAFKDTGLTTGLELPNPIQADSTGTMPAFWLADGSYRVRATSADGSRVFFDQPSVLALGASSGSGGGGSGVDQNAILNTGDVMWSPLAGQRAGCVRLNGRTIGSATSGATERANADCQALFEYNWTNFSDTICPVLTGRGASAAADWAANKQITLINMQDAGAFGLDDMGNSAAGGFTGVTFAKGDATTGGSSGGEATHTLTAAELPANIPNTATSHTTVSLDAFLAANASVNFGQSGSGTTFPAGSIFRPGASASTSTTVTINANGGGAHNNMPKFVLGTWYQKL